MVLTAARKPQATGPSVSVWQGVDRDGVRVRGETWAMNIAVVRAELGRQGISPIRIEKKPSP